MRQKGVAHFFLLMVLAIVLITLVILIPNLSTDFLENSPSNDKVSQSDDSNKIDEIEIPDVIEKINDEPEITAPRFDEALKDNVSIDRESWNEFTSYHHYVSFMYPQWLNRDKYYTWRYPEVNDPLQRIGQLEGKEVWMSLNDYNDVIDYIGDDVELNNMNVGDFKTIHAGHDSEYVIKKIRETINGSIFEDVKHEIGYWHPTHSLLFISKPNPIGKNIFLEMNFILYEDRDTRKSDFTKIAESLKFVDYDRLFVEQLGINSDFSLVKAEKDGGVFYIRSLPDNNEQNEVYLLVKDGKLYGYIVSRAVRLGDYNSKRAIVGMREVSGFEAGDKKLFLVDSVNPV